ncbi:MAG: phosphoserine phosphatase SerB [Parvibaculales bacterium]
MTVTHHIVFTCDPAQASLTSDICADWLTKHDLAPALRELGPGKAYEADVTAAQAHGLDVAQLSHHAAMHQADVNLVSTTNRRKKLLVADMESTIIEQECLDELAELLNLRPQIADITERAMRGEIEFEPALRERVALLKGLPEETLAQIYEEKVTLMPGAETLISTMNAHGAVCALVSGGFSYYAEKIADWLGFDRWRSNTLTIVGGALDGTVGDPILGRDAKAEFLQKWQQEMDLAQDATLAVGDGSNDLAMIGLAGFGVAFRAKPLVAEAAAISITYGDLTGLLYLQGFTDSEFAG